MVVHCMLNNSYAYLLCFFVSNEGEYTQFFFLNHERSLQLYVYLKDKP